MKHKDRRAKKMAQLGVGLSTKRKLMSKRVGQKVRIRITHSNPKAKSALQYFWIDFLLIVYHIDTLSNFFFLSAA